MPRLAIPCGAINRRDTRLVASNRYVFHDNTSVHYQMVSIGHDFYYLPVQFQDSNGNIWSYYAHGSFNSIYVNDLDHPTQILKQAIEEKTERTTESSERTVRIWNEVFQKEINTDPTMRASVYNTGSYGVVSIMPYVHYRRFLNNSSLPPALLVCKAMVDVYRLTGRVVLDACSTGNFVMRTSDNRVICLDANFALKYKPTNHPDRSVTSQHAWEEFAHVYPSFFEKVLKEQSDEFKRIVLFTKALIIVAILDLQINLARLLPSNTTDCDQAFFSIEWQLTTMLANCFNSQNQNIFIPQQQYFFTQSDLEKIAIHNREMSHLVTDLGVKDNSFEMQMARLTCIFPYVKWMCYLGIPSEERSELLRCETLNNALFNKLSYLSLDAIGRRLSEKYQTRLYRVPNQDASDDTRLYALISLIESHHVPAEIARKELRDLRVDCMRLLSLGYSHGLRRWHFDELSLDAKCTVISNEQCEQIVQALELTMKYRQSFTSVDFDRWVLSHNASLQEEIVQLQSNEQEVDITPLVFSSTTEDDATSASPVQTPNTETAYHSGFFPRPLSLPTSVTVVEMSETLQCQH